MLLGPQRESKFRRLKPIKNKRGQRRNLRWDSREVIPNVLAENEIYLESLVLVRHLKIEAWKIDELGFGSRWRLQRFEGGKNRCWTRFSLEASNIYGQFRNKITFYPVIEGAYVNTKNWYREEAYMWAEFGRRTPFGKRLSSKHSVEASAVGNTSSFGRRDVPRLKAETFGVRDDVDWIQRRKRVDDGYEMDMTPWC
jgi:hypothetical protein